MHTLTEQITVLELLIECIKEDTNKINDQAQTIPNLQYMKTHNK